MPRYCQILDLKDNPPLIAEYKHQHRQVWPEVADFISSCGILSMEIYCHQNRLMMVMETDEQFSFEKMAQLGEHNSKVQEWETLMWKYQKPLPSATSGAKWMLMDKIYDFKKGI